MIFGIATPLSLLSFWLPLLLSLKAFKEKNGSAHQFLLTYWLFYAIMNNFNHYIQLIFANLPLPDIAYIACALLNIWMFYCHGCLVVAHYYLPTFFHRVTGYLSLAEFDIGFLSPMVSPMLNAVADSKPLTRNLAPFLRGNKAFDSYLYRKDPHGNLVPSGYRTGYSVLQVGVDRFCYMDESAELHSRYLSSQNFLWGISQLFRPPKRVVRRGEPPRMPSGSHLYGKRGNRNDLYPPIGLAGPSMSNPRERDQREKEKDHTRGPGVYGYVNMGDKWARTRLARSRSVSDGEVERRAREIAYNGLFVPSVTSYHA